MSEPTISWVDWVDRCLLVELLGTVGLAISILPLLALLILRAWAGLPGFVICSLALPPVALAGCCLSGTALGLMGKTWEAGWGRALLGMVLGAGILGYWLVVLWIGLGW